MIPVRIHHVWLGATEPAPPPQARRNADSWREHHPDGEHRLWSGDEVEALFEAARPDLLRLYRGYDRWVQRADIARYLILHEHGGVYADHDIACRASWAPLLRRHGVILAPTWPVGVSNDLMAVEPGHPLMARALDGLPRAARRWDRPWVPPYVRVLASTGSLYLSAVVRRDTWPGLRLLDPGEYGDGAGPEALVRHGEGSSWHDWDGRFLKRLGRGWAAFRRGSAPGDGPGEGAP